MQILLKKKFPNTTFIFVDGDKKIHKILMRSITLQVTILQEEMCNIAPVPCGFPPDIVFYGGNGIGAKTNPVIDSEGQLIAVDIVNGGFGYSTPPNIDVIDPCQNGDGARLIAEILNGSVVNVIVLSTGSGYLAPKSSVPQYPSLVKISEVRVTNSGINYNCGVDELVVEPANGTQLAYNCDPFGRIRSVDILRSGNFTSLPNIRMKTKTGLNAEFIPVFSIEKRSTQRS